MSGNTIYMDVCCLNRPFDDISQDSVYLEAEAILSVLARCEQGDWRLMGSDVIDFEISKISDVQKLQKVKSLYTLASRHLTVNNEIRTMSREYMEHGIHQFDSLHLATAAYNKIDAFLTTDYKFLKAAKRLDIEMVIENPVIWFMEVEHDE